MNILFVFDADALVEKNGLTSLNENDTVYLFPLTSKTGMISRVEQIVKGLGGSVETLSATAGINDSAERIKKKYLGFIAEISRCRVRKDKDLKGYFAVDEDTSLWWFSLIAEKNTLKSDAFNRLAQLDAIARTVKDYAIEKIIFGCAESGLASAVKTFAKQNTVRFKKARTGESRGFRARLKNLQHFFYLRHLLLLLHSAIRFFLRTLKVKRKLGSLPRRPSGNNAVMIITYYPNINKAQAEQGFFKNRYFSSLQESLEMRGQDITWIAMYVEHNSVSFAESLQFAEDFIRKGYVFYFLVEFCSFAAQIRALLDMIASGAKFLMIERKIAEQHTFGEYNFYPVFRDDWYRSFFSITGYYGRLYYEMFKSLLGRFNNGKCLYYCEMHAWEKALASAKNALGCGISLMGYQHATVSSMLLNYFNDPSEFMESGAYMMPIPDAVICNGRIPYGYLRESGWPAEKLHIAEAIRYNSLKYSIKRKWNKAKDIVLIAFSISPEESSSILNMTWSSLRNMRDVEVWLKPHPFLRYESVLELSGLSNGDVPFVIKDVPIERLLPEVKVVITGESGVSVEALAFGCNVIIVNCPEWLNMSPLRSIRTDMVHVVDSPERLRRTVNEIISSPFDPEMRAREAEGIVNEFFCLDYSSDIPDRLLKLIQSPAQG